MGLSILLMRPATFAAGVENLALHPIQLQSVDPLMSQIGISTHQKTISVPGRTVAVALETRT